MKKSQSGFTLIELIVVIVLLGILGVTALGRFQDLSGDAQVAVLNGIATELSGASNINYAKSLTGTPAITVGANVALDVDTTAGADKCPEVTLETNLLTGGSLPADYSIASDNTVACNVNGAGDRYDCTVLLDDGAGGGTAGDRLVNGNEISTTFTMVCTD